MAIVQGGAHFSIRETQDEDAAVATIRAAYEAGVREFDTARAYATVDDATHNESLFARALAGRSDALIATKGGHHRVDRTTWAHDSRPARLRSDAELSLRALGRDSLALYSLHKPDGTTPIEESVAALDELRRAGLAERIGLCNVTADELDRALLVAPLDAVQVAFSPRLLDDRGVRDLATARSIALWGYSPLGGSRFRDEVSAGLPAAHAIAAGHGVSYVRVVLAWLLAVEPGVHLITGAGRPESARDSAAAIDLRLTDEEIDALTAQARALRVDG